jgi:hypothetical protein
MPKADRIQPVVNGARNAPFRNIRSFISPDLCYHLRGMSNGEPIPAILFKYLAPDRFHVLTDYCVRFTQRKFFSDDHELQPDYNAYGTVDEIRTQLKAMKSPPSGMPLRLLATLIGNCPAFS